MGVLLLLYDSFNLVEMFLLVCPLSYSNYKTFYKKLTSCSMGSTLNCSCKLSFLQILMNIAKKLK